MNPKIFGWEHLLIVSLSIALAVPSIIFMQKHIKEEKGRVLALKITAGVLLVAILTNRISLIFKYSTPEWYRIIPDSFCGMTSLVLALAVLFGKKDNNVLHYVWFLALLGGTVTMIYPDFIGQSTSVLYLPTISGLLHHILAVYLVSLLLTFKYVTPTYKKWYCTVFGFTTYITIGAFEINVLGATDAFYIHKPILSGTPLNVWVLIPLYIIIYGATIAIIEYIRIRKKNKISNNSKEDLDKNA